MANQNAIDIKFQDIAVSDLEVSLGKSLDRFTKELIKAASGAFGAKGGSPTNLGVLTDKKDAITGIRFGVEQKYAEAAVKIINDKLSKMSDRVGVGHVAQAAVSDRPVYTDMSVGVFDSAGLENLQEYLGDIGGRIIRKYPTAKDGRTTYRVRIPDARFPGTPADTSGMVAGIGKASFDRFMEESAFQAERSRAAEEQRRFEMQEWQSGRAYRNPRSGYVSGDFADKFFRDEEERRKELGIIEEPSDKKKPKLDADEQQKKSFFNSTTITLGALLVTTKKILASVLKLLDKELQQSYTAAAMNMDINDLASLEKGVEAMTGRTGIATAAARGVFSAFGPMKVSSEAARSVALAAGSGALEDVINNMTLGNRKTTEALRAILEGAYKNYAAGVNIYGEGTVGKEKAYADIRDELKNLGLEDMFGAYVQYMENVPDARDFDTFLKYRRIKNAQRGAAAGREASQLSTAADVAFTNLTNGVFWEDEDAQSVPDVDPNTLVPQDLVREGLMKGLGLYKDRVRGSTALDQIYNAVNAGYTIDPSILEEAKNILNKRLESIKDRSGAMVDTEKIGIPNLLKLLDLYEPTSKLFSMISPESIAAGTSMASLGGGTNYFDYSSVNNNTPAPVQGNGTFNIRIITDKTDVLFPGVDINADNFAVAKG